MASGAVKKLVIALAAVVLGFIALVLALPLIASTQLVRDRIALELSMWSGYRVEMASAPELRLWPNFRARLSNVSFHRWEDDGSVPVIAADGIEAGLSALAALSGNVVFTQLTVTRPSVHVWPSEPRADAPDLDSPGKLRQSIAAARALIEENPADPDIRRLPADPLGVIEFSEGRVTVHGEAGEAEVLTGLSGRISWPALDRPLTSSASGIWRGELVRLEASSDRPLMLVAGGTSPLRISIASALLNASFEGSANWTGGSHVDGSVQLSSPSLRRLLEWSHRDIAPGASIGSIAIEGRLSGTLDRMRVDDGTLTLDGSRATGTLELAPRKEIPSISGTLAFESFDIQSFLAAFSALTPDPWGRWRAMDDSISDQIGIDMRLSAVRATAGSLVLGNLAAAAQIRKGIATFDISDASAFGGRVQAAMRVDRAATGTEVEVRLRGEEIDMGALARTMQVQYLVPVSRGTFSIALKGRGSELYNVVATSSGAISASFGPGAMAGVDLERFRELAGSGRFFPLEDVGTGSLAFTGIDFKASVADGTAQVDKAVVKTADGQVALRGVVPLPGAGLALSGTVSTGGGGRDVPFFVGGTWSSPYISPIGPPMQ